MAEVCTQGVDTGFVALGYAKVAVLGIVQGITELFPVSSLGHSVILPALIGGRWARDLDVSAPESPYLAFIVGLHVATAIALLIYFWRDWVRVIGGFVTSIARREVKTADQRLAWLLVLGTIPLLTIAGLIEGFVSPLAIPYWLHGAFAILPAGGLAWYLLRKT